MATQEPAPPVADENAKILNGLDQAHDLLLGEPSAPPPPPAAAPVDPAPAPPSAPPVAPSPQSAAATRPATPPSSNSLAVEQKQPARPRTPPPGYQCPYELKYPDSIHKQVLAWMGDVLGKKLDAEPTDDGLQGLLKSGVLLCELVNVIKPGSVKRIEQKLGVFQQRENIARFLNAAKALGVASNELFDTQDLFDGRNMRQVLICVFSLGRATFEVPGYTGPTLGKPVRSKQGAHKKSQFTVNSNQGLWGKAGGAHMPLAGVGQAKMRPITTTGRPEIKSPVLA